MSLIPRARLVKVGNKNTVFVCAGLALCNVLVTAAAQAQFEVVRTFPAGLFPNSEAVGDFNGDGVPDLAVVAYGDVSVLLGNGDGSFQGKRVFSAAGATALFIAVGDFNGDGRLDLAVVDPGLPPRYFFSGVYVLLGNGDGSFRQPRSFGAGRVPVSVAVGDFDGDGVQDLAVANAGIPPEYAESSISVLLGNGDGSFQAPRNFPVRLNPASVAICDFNGDGRLDLAVANTGCQYHPFCPEPSFVGSVSVLLGNGDGSFQEARDFAAGLAPGSVAVGDFNGDGRSDLAVANTGSDPLFGGSVSVLLGNGDGSFQAARTFALSAVSYAPGSIAVGDFNGDGQPDLAVATRAFAVTVLLGIGDGSFQAPESYLVGRTPQSIVVGDFNGDGRPDLAVVDAARGSDTVSVLLSNPDGSFQAARYLAVNSPLSVAVGDFNGDGRQDLVAADWASGYPSGDVTLLLGNGDGSFQTARTFPFGARLPVFVAVGDFNGDGSPDLVVAYQDPGGVSVLLGNGDGSFQQALPVVVGFGVFSLAVGDFNGDGRPDLVLPGPGSVSLFLGNGDGTFQACGTFAVESPGSLAVGDFNGDGLLDLAAANGFANTVSVLLGNGDGSFQVPRYSDVGNPAGSLVVADFNADGFQDLAVGTAYPSTGVSVLLGNGDGSFQAARHFAVLGNGVAVGAVCDFNGDGFLDIATANGFTNTVSVLLGNGDGSFQTPRYFAVGDRANALALGDFNGDGRPDLAVANTDSDDVTVLINNTGR
jgi:hypothetical protein